jgi:mono/diheme cytochrome c family protein
VLTIGDPDALRLLAERIERLFDRWARSTLLGVKRRGALLLAGVVSVVIVVGCGSGSSAVVRTAPTVSRCLRANGIASRTIPLTDRVLPKGFVRGEKVVSVLEDDAVIWIYPVADDATQAFATEKASSPVAQSGNAIVGFPEGARPATARRARQIEACAFGEHANPRVGPLVVNLARPGTGRAVMLQSGCLACHRIGDQGNDGPGPNLTRVGTELAPSAIAHTLRHPAAPMPSFANLKQRDFRALVSYLSHLGKP